MEKDAQPARLRQMLGDKDDPSLDEALQLALADEKVRMELVAGLVSKKDVYRYNCFEVLLRISQDHPALLYPEWDRLVELLDSDNAFFRSIALQLIANLTGADDEERFESPKEGLFDRYFDLLDDEKVMVARHLVQSAERIARQKPHLRERITQKLLDIDQTHHAEGRKALIEADAIAYFETFFEASSEKDQERILTFAEGLVRCSSPKARKAASAFLQAHKRASGRRSDDPGSEV